MTKNETLNTINTLRSTHWNFNSKPVSKEDVETIIRHSTRAANSDNLTDYSIVVVDDPEIINLITDGESGGKPCTCLLYFIDHTRIIQYARTLGYKDFTPLNRLYNFFISVADVNIAAQTAIIAAKSMGIDSLCTNFPQRFQPKRLMEMFDMPKKYCFPVLAVVLGYSDTPVEQTTGRLDAKHIIHYGKYHYANAEEVGEMISEMDAVYPHLISDKYQHAVDWYFNEWFIEWYNEDVYRELVDCWLESGLIAEPTIHEE